MRFIVNAIKLLAVLVAVLVVIAFFLPRHVAVSRSLAINAPVEQVFSHVNSLRAFAVWSPWSDYDPDMKVTFSGPETGVGSRMDWTSDQQNVGNGTQIITASEENQRVETSLDFGAMGRAVAEFTLTPAANGTEVRWGFVTDLGMNPVARWMGLVMDRWVGSDFENGLARLKIAAESDG